jgi:hypothetical protein
VQKLTIIAVLLSAIVLSIAAELVSQDYIQKVHPEIEDQVQANILKLGSFTDYLEPKSVIDQAQTTQDILDEIDPSQDINSSPLVTSVRLETLITALDISRLQLKPAEAPEKLFDSFQISEELMTLNVYALIASDSQTIASIQEITTDDEKKSKQIFEEIKAIAGSVPSFDINQTNEFGDQSFYINPTQEVDNAFLVNQKGTLIYAVAYEKQYHDEFKEWFKLLL